MADHTSPKGEIGGGGKYLVSRTFQGTAFIDSNQVPGIKETAFQLQHFIQYNSMTDKQRRRHVKLTTALMKNSDIFHHTNLPNYKYLSTIYGTKSKESMWHNLPIPPVQNFDGVAYVNPLHALKFMLAHGFSIDNFYVECGSGAAPVLQRNASLTRFSILPNQSWQKRPWCRSRRN